MLVVPAVSEKCKYPKPLCSWEVAKRRAKPPESIAENITSILCVSSPKNFSLSPGSLAISTFGRERLGHPKLGRRGLHICTARSLQEPKGQSSKIAGSED